MDTPAWAWAAFVAAVFVLLVLDVAVVHRRPHAIGTREAAVQSAAWVALALSFGGVLLAWQGGDVAGQYFSGYLVEKSLSADNVFAWALIFAHFSVPAEFQHRVLFWGIFGAIVLRGAFIFGGIALLERFEWVVYAFGAFLLVTAIRLIVRDDSDLNPNRHPFGGFVRRWRPSMADLGEPRFVARHEGRLVATPLLAVLLLIETTDVVFAVDSIPAVLGISHDEFVVFTSNVFAILGLRALYFLLTSLQARFTYLQQGMAMILAFIGLKMLLSTVVDVPIGLSLGVIAIILIVSIFSSLRAHTGEAVWPTGADRDHAGDRRH